MKNKKIALFFGIVAFFILISSALFAQEELLAWVNAPLGELPPMGAYSISYYGDKDVKNQDTSLQLIEHNLWGFMPLLNKPDKDLAIFGPFEIKNMKTDAILPNSGAVLPENLYDLSFGPAYRCKFKNDWIGGVAFLFGSASDKPFHSADELSYRLDAYVKIPSSNNNAWLFFVDYYNNREYLRNIPIPGAAYLYNPSDKLIAVIGLPVATLQYMPVDNLTVNLTYIMVTSVHAKVAYNLTASLNIYGAFDWNNELYARADREREKERIFYYEKLLSLGIHWQAFKYVGIDLSGGYAFNRFFFEGEQYNEKDGNNIDIENGPFVSLHVGIPF